MTWHEEHAPYLAGIAAILLPSPLSFLKGRVPVTIPVDAIKAALQDAQKLVKVSLEFIPGETAEADAATILAAIEPAVKLELESLNVPPFASAVALKILAFIVTVEVKAAYAA